MRKKPKVTVIGAGNVGATCAQRIVESDLADVVLIDIVDGLAEGKAIDMMQSAPVLGFSAQIVGTTDYKRAKDSSIVVITAGLARKPGMSRDDLLIKNTEIVSGIVKRIAHVAPKAVLVLVTNPLDVMCAVALKTSEFPANRVIGMAGELDSARFSYFIRLRTELPVHKIHSYVLGAHGDLMVPLPRFSQAGTKKLDRALNARTIKTLVEKTKKGGAQIVSLLKSGSAYYAPSAAAFKMVQLMLTNDPSIICATVYLNGDYGIDDCYCGVPVSLGKGGLRNIIKWELTAEEHAMLKASAQSIKNNAAKVIDALR